jgi:medium-chain acyl-[acyl-carrier-protein] hydrolase
MSEPPIDELDAFVEPLLEAIEPVTDVPFLFYGHSMGALIAYELARRLWDEFRQSPQRLFVGARRAPHLVSRNQTLHEQSSEKVRDFLLGLRSSAAEVLQNDEIMELLLPALRADLKLDGLYEYLPGSGVSCPITAFTGKDDEYVLRDEISGWSLHTGGEFDLNVIPGDHFFIDHPQHRFPVIRALIDEL